MDNTTIQQITGEIATLITILSPLALALFGAYKAQLHKYVEAKIDTIKDDNLRKVANDILDRVDAIATNVITNIDVNMKPTIIEDIKKGSMTKDDLNNLKSIAKNTILEQLTKDSKIALGSTVGDMNSYINTLIEAKLAELKVNPTSPVSKTVLPEVVVPVVDTTELENKLSQFQTEKDNLTIQNQALQQQVNDLNNKLNTIQSAIANTTVQ